MADNNTPGNVVAMPDQNVKYGETITVTPVDRDFSKEPQVEEGETNNQPHESAWSLQK